MGMPLFARIAPRDGLVAILNAEGLTECVYDIDGSVVAGRSALSYVLHAFETVIVPVRDVNEAVGVLRLRSDMSACLDMVLMLFDDRISLKTRTQLALTLNGLLAEVAIRNFVQDILYARPLADIANSDEASAASRGIAATSKFVRQLIRKQPFIQQLYDAWLTANRECGIEQEQKDRTLAYLSKKGVFRRLVLEVGEKHDVDLIWRDITSDPEFEQQKIEINDLKAYFQRVDEIVPEIISRNALSSSEEEFILILDQHVCPDQSLSETDGIVTRVRVLAENVQLQLPESGMHRMAVADLLLGFSGLRASMRDPEDFLKKLCDWAGLDTQGFSESDMRQMFDLAFVKNSAENLAEWLIDVNLRKIAKNTNAAEEQTPVTSAEASQAFGGPSPD